MPKVSFIFEWKDKNGIVHKRSFLSSQESQAKNFDDTLNKKGAKGLLLYNSVEFTGTRSISWI